MESETTIIVLSVLGGLWLLLCVLMLVLFLQLHSLRKRVNEMQATGRIRVQKLRMNNDRNHAFHNPALSPDEELSKRGFSMYEAEEHESERDRDVEGGRGRERQSGGLNEELAREIDSRQQRQSAPPFLLQSIEENKRKRLGNPVANGRQSDTNPNFIY